MTDDTDETEVKTNPGPRRARRDTGGWTSTKKGLVAAITGFIAMATAIIPMAFSSCEAARLAKAANQSAQAATERATVAGVQAQTATHQAQAAASQAQAADREQGAGYEATREKLNLATQEMQKLRQDLDDCLGKRGRRDEPFPPTLSEPLPLTPAAAAAEQDGRP